VPDIKLAQAAILCHCLSAFVQQPGQQQQQQQPPEQQQRHVSSMPVIIGGDFNSVWRKYSSDAWDQVRGVLVASHTPSTHTRCRGRVQLGVVSRAACAAACTAARSCRQAWIA
jgi:hypothetical protein